MFNFITSSVILWQLLWTQSIHLFIYVTDSCFELSRFTSLSMWQAGTGSLWKLLIIYFFCRWGVHTDKFSFSVVLLSFSTIFQLLNSIHGVYICPWVCSSAKYSSRTTSKSTSAPLYTFLSYRHCSVHYMGWINQFSISLRICFRLVLACGNIHSLCLLWRFFSWMPLSP